MLIGVSLVFQNNLHKHKVCKLWESHTAHLTPHHQSLGVPHNHSTPALHW